MKAHERFTGSNAYRTQKLFALPLFIRSKTQLRAGISQYIKREITFFYFNLTNFFIMGSDTMGVMLMIRMIWVVTYLNIVGIYSIGIIMQEIPIVIQIGIGGIRIVVRVTLNSHAIGSIIGSNIVIRTSIMANIEFV